MDIFLFVIIIVGISLIYAAYEKKKGIELKMKKMELETKKIELEIARMKQQDERINLDK
ncbi:hypothetical protein [Bacillus coahuilensis]|uniref:hypothetical protein n=1 Tax=Bacillus coahuilensis TaxID=408580 RepID=UPI000ADA7427|nr:hypothetical protein [Bacillus coahuilensis]